MLISFILSFIAAVALLRIGLSEHKNLFGGKRDNILTTQKKESIILRKTILTAIVFMLTSYFLAAFLYIGKSLNLFNPYDQLIRKGFFVVILFCMLAVITLICYFYLRYFCFRQALLPEVITNKGISYFKQGQYEKAISEYKKALILDEYYIFAHLNLASAYVNLRQHSNALVSYKKVLAIRPDYIEVSYLLAMSYKILGLFNEAKDTFLKTIELAKNKDNKILLEQSHQAIEEMELVLDAISRCQTH